MKIQIGKIYIADAYSAGSHDYVVVTRITNKISGKLAWYRIIDDPEEEFSVPLMNAMNCWKLVDTLNYET